MIREIKYKAIDLKTKEVRYGNYLFTENCTAVIIDTSFGKRVEYPVLCDSVKQFINRTDKNGMEVYEGDRCRCNNGREFEVVWLDCGFVAKCEPFTKSEKQLAIWNKNDGYSKYFYRPMFPSEYFEVISKDENHVK